MNPGRNFMGSITENDEELDVIAAIFCGIQSLEIGAFSP